MSTAPSSNEFICYRGASPVNAFSTSNTVTPVRRLVVKYFKRSNFCLPCQNPKLLDSSLCKLRPFSSPRSHSKRPSSCFQRLNVRVPNQIGRKWKKLSRSNVPVRNGNRASSKVKLKKKRWRLGARTNASWYQMTRMALLVV